MAAAAVVVVAAAAAASFLCHFMSSPTTTLTTKDAHGSHDAVGLIAGPSVIDCSSSCCFATFHTVQSRNKLVSLLRQYRISFP